MTEIIDPRRHCVICNELVMPRTDRTLRRHGFRRVPYKPSCKGSGWFCLEDSAKQLAEILATASSKVINATLAHNITALGKEAADRLHAAAEALID